MLDLARRIWTLLDAVQKRSCVFVVFATTVAACFTLAGVAGITPFFAVLSDATIIDRNAVLGWIHRALGMPTFDVFLVWLGIGFVVLLLLANLINLLTIFLVGRFSHRVGASFHVLLFDEYLHRDLKFHARNNSTVLATNVVQEVNRTVGGVIQSGLTLIGGLASITLIAAAVIVANPTIAAGATLLLGTSYAVIYALVRRQLIRNGAITTRSWHARAKVIAESLAAIRDIIVFHAQREMAGRVAGHSDAIAAAQASTPVIATSPRYVLECVTGAGLVAAGLWIYRQSGPGQWATHLAFLGLAAYRLLPAVQHVFASTARIRSEREAFEHIYDDLYSARQRSLKSSATDEGWKGRPRKEIRVVDVSYLHSSKRIAGIADVSLVIPAGALVGLVGPNGSGKTTLAELVLGLLKPDEGHIEIDGEILDDDSKDSWLRTVAYVPQCVVILEATIAENIAFGLPAQEIDFERAREAAREARLDLIIESMPDGLATVIGENGAQLSGGQRQRMGIARALYRRPSLLVMDEATNALDSLTEAEVVDTLGALRGSCTTILIGHQWNAIRCCDVIYELYGGRVMMKDVDSGISPSVHSPARSAGQ